MQTEELYALYLANPSVKTDTRELQPGDIFFALKGPNFNGNFFAQQALESGAAYAVIDEPVNANGNRTILVEDVLTALQELAGFHRLQLNIPFLAITGSNGKTTTKELIHQVLSRKYNTSTTKGNLNNQIGIPLTILRVPRDADIAVIEMGANHLKEIERYCRYTRPTHGLITNTGKAHLEGFGSAEGVRKGKGELFDYLRNTGGTAFVAWDYEHLREMSHGIRKIVRYGLLEGSITGNVSKNDPYLEVELSVNGSITPIQTSLVGEYNLLNVLAACAIGNYFGVDVLSMKAAIELYIPSNSRSQMLEQDGNHIILDAYNANPSSMRSAIENFAGLKAGKKILILGAMAELGTDSIREHQALINLIGEHSWEAVVLVGGDFLQIAHPYISLKNATEARRWWLHQCLSDSFVLVKGSRSMQMEKILGRP